jgi:hypothetical protein
VFDSLLFEDAGVPAVPIITEPFIPTAIALSELQGRAGHGYVAVPHPITSLDPDELRERARGAAALVEAILLGCEGPPAAASEEISTLDGLIDELARGLRSDGADLTGVRSGNLLELQLHFPDEACAECVMPYDTLAPILEGRARAALGPEIEIDLHDPRVT